MQVIGAASPPACDLARCDSERLPEGLPKVSWVGVAQAGGDLGDRTVSALQQPKRAFHPPRGDVPMGSEPGRAPKSSEKVERTQGRHPGQLAKQQSTLEPCIHELRHPVEPDCVELAAG